jgi:hypothetical protein
MTPLGLHMNKSIHQELRMSEEDKFTFQIYRNGQITNIYKKKESVRKFENSKRGNQTSYIEGQTLYNVVYRRTDTVQCRISKDRHCTMTKREKHKVKTKMDHKHYTKKKRKKGQIEQHQPHKKPQDELRSSRRVSSSCYNSTTHRVTPAKNQLNVRIVLEMKFINFFIVH